MWQPSVVPKMARVSLLPSDLALLGLIKFTHSLLDEVAGTFRSRRLRGIFFSALGLAISVRQFLDLRAQLARRRRRLLRFGSISHRRHLACIRFALFNLAQTTI